MTPQMICFDHFYSWAHVLGAVMFTIVKRNRRYQFRHHFTFGSYGFNDGFAAGAAFFSLAQTSKTTVAIAQAHGIDVVFIAF